MVSSSGDSGSESSRDEAPPTKLQIMKTSESGTNVVEPPTRQETCWLCCSPEVSEGDIIDRGRSEFKRNVSLKPLVMFRHQATALIYACATAITSDDEDEDEKEDEDELFSKKKFRSSMYSSYSQPKAKKRLPKNCCFEVLQNCTVAPIVFCSSTLIVFPLALNVYPSEREFISVDLKWDTICPQYRLQRHQKAQIQITIERCRSNLSSQGEKCWQEVIFIPDKANYPPFPWRRNLAEDSSVEEENSETRPVIAVGLSQTVFRHPADWVEQGVGKYFPTLFAQNKSQEEKFILPDFISHRIASFLPLQTILLFLDSRVRTPRQLKAAATVAFPKRIMPADYFSAYCNGYREALKDESWRISGVMHRDYPACIKEMWKCLEKAALRFEDGTDYYLNYRPGKSRRQVKDKNSMSVSTAPSLLEMMSSSVGFVVFNEDESYIDCYAGINRVWEFMKQNLSSQRSAHGIVQILTINKSKRSLRKRSKRYLQEVFEFTVLKFVFSDDKKKCDWWYCSTLRTPLRIAKDYQRNEENYHQTVWVNEIYSKSMLWKFLRRSHFITLTNGEFIKNRLDHELSASSSVSDMNFVIDSLCDNEVIDRRVQCECKSIQIIESHRLKVDALVTALVRQLSILNCHILPPPDGDDMSSLLRMDSLCPLADIWRVLANNFKISNFSFVNAEDQTSPARDPSDLLVLSYCYARPRSYHERSIKAYDRLMEPLMSRAIANAIRNNLFNDCLDDLCLDSSHSDRDTVPATKINVWVLAILPTQRERCFKIHCVTASASVGLFKHSCNRLPSVQTSEFAWCSGSFAIMDFIPPPEPERRRERLRGVKTSSDAPVTLFGEDDNSSAQSDRSENDGENREKKSPLKSDPQNSFRLFDFFASMRYRHVQVECIDPEVARTVSSLHNLDKDYSRIVP